MFFMTLRVRHAAGSAFFSRLLKAGSRDRGARRSALCSILLLVLLGCASEAGARGTDSEVCVGMRYPFYRDATAMASISNSSDSNASADTGINVLAGGVVPNTWRRFFTRY